jgi:hypothetical protein
MPDTHPAPSNFAPEWRRGVPLDVLEVVEKVARLVEHRRAGGTDWEITLEADGERMAVVERDCRGLRVFFVDSQEEAENA